MGEVTSARLPRNINMQEGGHCGKLIIVGIGLRTFARLSPPLLIRALAALGVVAISKASELHSYALALLRHWKDDLSDYAKVGRGNRP